ncbi:MAG: AMIN domain-containing protein [Aquincola sp.]|nr:AMIN domain-containing protein [Aquincola sp.]
MRNSKEKRIMNKWRVWGGALALALAAPVTFAQGVIQSITSTQQSGADVVRIELSEPLAAVPAGFAIQQPARIAIDLPGIGNGMGKPSVEINQGNLRSVNVAQAGDRTRLVLNLKQAATYRAQLDGKALLIVVDSSPPAAVAAVAPAAAGAAPAATPAAAATFAPSQNRDPQSLREIDFRRGVDGAGRAHEGGQQAGKGMGGRSPARGRHHVEWRPTQSRQEADRGRQEAGSRPSRGARRGDQDAGERERSGSCERGPCDPVCTRKPHVTSGATGLHRRLRGDPKCCAQAS